MTTTGKLSAGERLLLRRDDSRFQLVSGSVEVYAVTRQGKGEEEALSFRQFYLLDLAVGEMAFPAIDEFEEIFLQVYATEDTEYILTPLTEIDIEELRLGLMHWFRSLIELPWLRLYADMGDDMLKTWQKGETFRDLSTREEILSGFAEHEGILSMLLGMKFGSEDKRLKRRILLRKKAKARMVENGIRSLLGEELLFSGEQDGSDIGKTAEEAAFVAHRVAKALGMPTESIAISEENASGLDYVSLLRRLLQKGNMQMRLVTLHEDWQKKDTGTMIGFYTPEEGGHKELAAFIPETP